MNKTSGLFYIFAAYKIIQFNLNETYIIDFGGWYGKPFWRA